MAEPRTNPFVIDLNDLAGEWQRQPKHSRDAGVREADARHEHTQAKAALAVVAARLYLRIRSDPEGYDLRAKPTKDEIDAAVTVHEDHLAAVHRVNEAQYVWDLAKADTVAFIDRRKALENEVELLALNYRSETEPRVLSEDAGRVLARRQRGRTYGEGIDLNDD